MKIPSQSDSGAEESAEKDFEKAERERRDQEEAPNRAEVREAFKKQGGRIDDLRDRASKIEADRQQDREAIEDLREQVQELRTELQAAYVVIDEQLELIVNNASFGLSKKPERGMSLEDAVKETMGEGSSDESE